MGNTTEGVSAAVEPDHRIGEQIRELRRIKGLTLQELAGKIGVSIGYLSQVERNRSKLPIGVLKGIADALGVHIHWFFQPGILGPEEERDMVVRAGNRRRMSFTDLGIVEELLSPNLAGPLELLMSTIQPGADSGEYSHEGAEAGVVIEGRLDLWVGERFLELQAGDSFAFKSTEVHRCRNPGRRACKVVWVITPPHY
ncbi:MAG: transcriptional regulator, family [Rubritepida sp.]|nr:transcriptional regulator, family [Rubritepida sp.]